MPDEFATSIRVTCAKQVSHTLLHSTNVHSDETISVGVERWVLGIRDVRLARVRAVVHEVTKRRFGTITDSVFDILSQTKERA